MSLIKCPECQKEISNKALSCPNCGFPIQDNNSVYDSDEKEILEFPDLPEDLSIGKRIFNFGGGAVIDGVFEKNINTIENIYARDVKVILHTHGIRLAGKNYEPLLDISNSQVISLKKTTREELASLNKSVIGRAVSGGLILGPLGAIIGAMSGIGYKQKTKNVTYLVINFWDLNSKKPQTILISGNPASIQLFIMRNETERHKNVSKNRKPEKGCFGIVVFLIFLQITLLINLFLFVFI